MTGHGWDTLDEEIAYTCEGFDIVTEQVRLPDGTRAAFDYLSEDESVVILPFTPEGEVVVIDEWRQAVKRLNRGLPAGGIEDGEDRVGAARRELREETGYEADDLEPMTTMEPANGFSDAVFHYFVARGCEPSAEQALDYNESISVATTTMETLLDAARDGELRDGRTAFGVLYYALLERDAGPS